MDFAMRSLKIAAVVCAAVVFSGQVAANEYYKWVDDDGVTHYTVAAPKDRPSELVRVSGGKERVVKKAEGDATSAKTFLPGDEKGSAIQAKAKEAEKTAEQPTMSAIDPVRCDGARRNIEMLNSYPRIRVTDPDGSIRYLTDAERADKMAEAETAVRESCE